LALMASTSVLGDPLVGITKPDASAWPDKPVAIVVERNPWAMVMGADLPSVLVFSDGTVLRADPNSKNAPAYLVSQFRGSEWDRLMTSIGPTPAFDGLKNDYAMTTVTDRPTTAVTLFGKGGRKSVSVYGYSTAPQHTQSTYGDRAGVSAAPAEFDRVVKLLTTLAPINETPWHPRFVEVMLWPFEYSRETPIQWPTSWPTSGPPTVFQRGHSWSVVLPSSELPRLRALVGQLHKRQAVLWNGHKWSIDYRLVLPGGEVATRIAAPARVR
jgi:hypothetical protein